MSMIAAYLAGLSGFGTPTSSDPRSHAVPGASSAGQIAAPQQIQPGNIDAADVDLLDQAEALVRDGRPSEATRLLTTYLRTAAVQGSERHSRALFLMSDLHQMTGEVQLALAPLFQILRYPPSQATAERARQRLALLVNAREQQLINAEDFIGLVGYFEFLVREDPGYDGHRLKLARWLLKTGEPEAAEERIRQTGTVGVTQAEIEALQNEISIARTALPVEREAGAMYTAASVVGAGQPRQFRFLIDTGATMTGLAESRLKSLGASLVQQGIRVQTANGIVELPVYRLRELRVGALVLKDMAVLGFADLPRGADGILGMDVLSRLGGSLAGAVGRP